MGKVDKFRDRTDSVFPDEAFERNENRKLRGERLPVSFYVLATYNGSLIQGYIAAVNLSWSGMLLETNFPLNVRDRISLEFTLPDSHVAIKVKARVVRHSAGRIAEEASLIGVAFEEMEPNVQRMIAGFVLENLPTD